MDEREHIGRIEGGPESDEDIIDAFIEMIQDPRSYEERKIGRYKTCLADGREVELSTAYTPYQGYETAVILQDQVPEPFAWHDSAEEAQNNHEQLSKLIDDYETDARTAKDLAVELNEEVV